MAEQDVSRSDLLSHFGGYLDSYVSVADAKAGAIAGASGALLLFVATHVTNPSAQSGVLAVAGLSLALAFLLALTSLYPRSASSGNGVVSWVDAAGSGTPDEFVRRFQATSMADLERQMIERNYWVAMVLRKKSSSSASVCGFSPPAYC